MMALWRPAWHELDQALAVGDEADFAFCYGDAAPGHSRDLFFHQPLLRTGPPFMLRVRIRAIRHSSLGAVQRIRTTGLVYEITLSAGELIRVEAEETPGAAESGLPDGVRAVENWDMSVELDIA